MRRARRSGLNTVVCLIAISAIGAGAEAVDRRSIDRAGRRAYTGAPPVIPHQPLGAACTSCHGGESIEVEELGISPASPHSNDGTTAHCRQCHVAAQTDGTFRRSDFAGLSPMDKSPAHRANPIAPPVIPHRIFMREQCLACHGGQGARAEIRTTHEDRINCRQCHLAGPAATADAPTPP